MKILLVNPYTPDYMTNLLFHGLINCGHDVTELNYMDYMRVHYKDIIDRKTLYGYGFSYAFSINDDINKKAIDKSIIPDQIAEHYFDIVIYSHINNENAYIDLVLEKYNLGEIFIIDGADTGDYNEVLVKRRPNNILYFKREYVYGNEIYDTNYRVFPISYAFPKEKFQSKTNTKNQLIINDCSYGAYWIMKKQKYVCETEQDYYNRYNDTAFALTCAKGGYDCMRHYEIIASYCLPVFIDFNKMPRGCMFGWPSEYQFRANSMYFDFAYFRNSIKDSLKFSTKYFQLLDNFYDYAYNNLTTEHLANYVLSFC